MQKKDFLFIQKLLNLPKPPEAIFAVIIFVVTVNMKAAKEKGLNLPYDFT